MGIFSDNTPTQTAPAPVVKWQDCYPKWAAYGLIPLHAPGEQYSTASGELKTAQGKEPVNPTWQRLPAARIAAMEGTLETFKDIAHEIERGRNIGLVIPADTVCLDMDNPALRDAVLSLYPDAPAQLSPRGGVHLFFRVSGGEEFKATAKAEVDGIEYDIRSAGRAQVACYPSRTAHGVYSWLRPLPLDHSSLPLRPDSLLKYLATASSGTNVVHQTYGPMPVNPAAPNKDTYAVLKELDKQLYTAIAKQTALGNKVGGRNNAMVRAVGMFLGTCRDRAVAPTPEPAFAALLPCILADTSGDASNPPPSPAELWSACCRLCDQELAKWLASQTLLAAVNQDLNRQRQADEDKQKELQRSLAERLNVAPAELKKQAILYLDNGRHYYVLDEKTGAYVGPTSSNGLLQRITEGASGLFNQTDIYEISPQGGVTMRPVHFILRDFGKPVTRIDRLAGLQHPLYDKRTETMIMGVWKPRDLVPEFHPQIDQWLKLLGGEDYAHLADWIATLTDTERPNSCLYLKGPATIGKNLLVDGLARLWGRKAVRYRDVMARFNDSFLKSPLVHLDEGITDRTDSLRFREFISETEHVIETKGQPQFTLQGAARVIVTANNVNALKISESLNTDDIDAISSRIMWISTGPLAASYLHELRGRKTTTAWVEDDLIAKHALWLKQNQVVTDHGHENRFLVPGAYHPEKLAMLRAHRGNAGIYEVIATYIMDAAMAHGKHVPFPQYQDGIRFVKGTVALRWKGIAEYWSLHEKQWGRLPNMHDVAYSLKIISKEIEVAVRTTLGPAKFWLADYDMLMDEIERIAPNELIKVIEDFLNLSIDDKPAKG